MASARTHEAIARELNKEYGMDDTLLRTGTISPDCWRNVDPSLGVKDKDLSHFWDFRIKNGQANDYAEFYIKYYNQLSNPFYFGYLIHLIADQFWKTYVDPKYEIQENGINGFRMRDGSFHIDENHFGYYEDVKIQKMIAKKYDLGYLPIYEKDIPNFYCKIDELNISGLFGTNGSLNYVNSKLSLEEEVEDSLIYDFEDILNSIQEAVIFIKDELKRLKTLKLSIDSKFKIAIDIDDTLLSTKVLELYYWDIFLQDNPDINPNKKYTDYTWGDIELERFWNEYREKMAFGKPKEGAVECLNYLIKKGIIIDLLSARPLNKYASLKEKLIEHFERNNIHYNYLNLGFYSKAEFLKEHNYDLLIDDNIRQIKEAKEIGINTILFGPPNPNYSGYQTDNWNEVPSIIEKIINN